MNDLQELIDLYDDGAYTWSEFGQYAEAAIPTLKSVQSDLKLSAAANEKLSETVDILQSENAALREEADRHKKERVCLMVEISDRTGQMHTLQAKIDALMLEYCPDEMTPEQIENWGKHQQVLIGEKDATDR